MQRLKKHVIIDLIDVETIMYDANDGYELLIQQARENAQDLLDEEGHPDHKERRAWGFQYDKLIQGRTRTIEDFGAKPKLDDQLSVNAPTHLPTDSFLHIHQHKENTPIP